MIDKKMKPGIYIIKTDGTVYPQYQEDVVAIVCKDKLFTVVGVDKNGELFFRNGDLKEDEVDNI